MFHYFWVPKKYMNRTGEGVSSFSVEKFLSRSAKNFRRGTLWCFINFGYRKFLDKKGGEYQYFSSKIICLRVPKDFVGEHFSVSLISGIQKIYVSEGYVTIFDFQSKLFVSQCPKIPWANPSLMCFRKSPVAKKFKDEKWGRVLRFSVENFLSRSAKNFRWGTLLCFINFGYRKCLDKKGGLSKFFVENYLSHSAENFRRGDALVFH